MLKFLLTCAIGIPIVSLLFFIINEPPHWLAWLTIGFSVSTLIGYAITILLRGDK